MIKRGLSSFSRLAQTAKEGVPSFLFSGAPIEKLGIPVFLLHRVQADEFRRWLRHLIGNGYRTLGFFEFYDLLQKKKPSRERAVLLTFDDGWQNQWEVAFPILKELGLKAIFFVNPPLLSNGSGNDHGFNFFDWSQARTMVEAGSVEIHSHTLTHEPAFTGSEIVDFQHPRADGKPYYPWLWSLAGEKPGTSLWGAPIYRLKPRLMGPRYLDDLELRQACLKVVEKNGGVEFFRNLDWKNRLLRFSRDYLTRHPDSGRWEIQDEYRAFVHDSLTRSKAMIESHLNRPCQSVAFPWEQASPLALEEARRAGYEAAFWGRGVYRTPSRYGQDLFALPRIQGYWIPTLPGEGRLSPAQHFVKKFFTLSLRAS